MIRPEDFLEHIKTKQFYSPMSLEILDEGIKLEEVVRELIINALNEAGHNQTKAAGLLGISRNTLIYRMEEYNVRKLS